MWFRWHDFWNWSTAALTPATQEVDASVQLKEPIRPANQGSLVNSQSGATYTLNGVTDRGKAVILTNAGGAAVTLPDPAGFAESSTFLGFIQNIGAGSATLTPAGGKTIDGVASITLAQFKGALLFSDGTNWFTVRG